MTALAAATRPTRRDIRRHPLRMLAAVLPVALAAGLVVGFMTWNRSSYGFSQLAETRTSLQYYGGSCRQSYDSYSWDCGDSPARGVEEVDFGQLLDDNLPPGFSAHLELNVTVRAAGPGGQAQLSVTQLPPERVSALFGGSEANVPGDGEVVVPRGVAEVLGAGVGDLITVDLRAGSRDLTVRAVSPSMQAFVVEPTLTEADQYNPAEFPDSFPTWVVTGPRPVTWEDVLALNEAGFVVYSRDVIDDPPPEDQLYEDFRAPYPAGAFIPGERLLAIPLYFSWAIAVVVLMLLITPVFTTAVSRQSRVYALMSSQGATPRQIRLAALVYGAFTGALGSSVGVVAGVAGAALVWRFQWPGWPVAVPWRAILAVWIIAILGALLASVLPARMAARNAVSAGVQGASTDRLRGWRMRYAIGPALLVVAVGLSLLMRERWGFNTMDFFAIPVTFVVLLALTASAPALVLLSARVARAGPLPFRLAGRELKRQSLRSVPALAAVAGLIFLVTSVLVSSAAHEIRGNHLAASVSPPELVLLSASVDAGEQERLARIVEAHLGPAEVHPLYGVAHTAPDYASFSYAEIGDPPECDRSSVQPLTWGYPAPESAVDPTAGAEESRTCLPFMRNEAFGGVMNGSAAVLVLEPRALDVFTWSDERSRAEAEQRLADGTVLINRDFAGYPTAQPFRLFESAGGSWSGGLTEPAPVVEAEVETAAVLPSLYYGAPVLSQATADSLGLETTRVGTAFLADEAPSAEEQSRVNEALRNASPSAWVSYNTLTTFSVAVRLVTAAVTGMVVVGIVALILALSAPQQRRRFALLNAVGAPPGTGARITAWSGGSLAFVGALAGLLTGYVTVWVTSSPTERDLNGEILYTGLTDFIEFDWSLAFILLLVMPGLSAGVGALLHRREPEATPRED